MSLLSSMYTGISGLQANGMIMGIIGDNIANVNTIGFKGTRGNFTDVIAMSGMGTSNAANGAGTALASVQTLLGQGSLQQTEVATDLAITGAGFFVVANETGGRFYTRAGQFKLDMDGYLVNHAGLIVQGFGIDATTGITASNVDDLNLTSSKIPPSATTDITIKANLNAEALVADTFTTGTSAYDSLGVQHQVNITFTKTAANAWSYTVEANGEEITGGLPGDPPFLVADGTLTFDTSGKLDTQTDNPVAFTFTGAGSQTLAMDFGDALTGVPPGTGIAGTTQFAGESTVTYQSQNGFATGALQSVNISSDGMIVGSFSNGQLREVAVIALANFQSLEGLKRVGGGLFTETRASGEPLIGKPTTGNRGALQSFSLEQSNVDMAEQFVHLISAQRGFQANSKIITTADAMLGEVLNIKR